MKIITLNRTLYTPDGTFGLLRDNNYPICITLERPWLDNKPFISCIPPGLYELTYLVKSPSFKYPHYWLRNVENRTWIKIHIANVVSELSGCIAVGISFTMGKLITTDSTFALDRLMKYLEKFDGDKYIDIIEPPVGRLNDEVC